MKKSILIIGVIALFVLYCTKEEDCSNVANGTWKLVRVMKNNQVECVYDSTFYYTYTFENSKATTIQYRNGVDSFVRTFNVDCNNFFITSGQDDTLYYGGLTNYGVLIR